MKTWITVLIVAGWGWAATADVPLNPEEVQPWEHLTRRLDEAGVDTDSRALIDSGLAHPDFAVRSAAVQILGLRKEVAAEDELRRVLATDEERLVREDAAIALVRLGHPEALEKVREFMRTERSRQHQVRLAGQLAEFGDFSGYPLAVKAATAEDENLRLVASGVIRRFLVGGLPDPRRLPSPEEMMLSLLRDRSPKIRQRTLLEVGIAVNAGRAAESWLGPVKRLSEEDPDPDVRQSARGVLLSVLRVLEQRGKAQDRRNIDP